ncbi:MAG: hypothetical protein SVY10_12110 [Thermodesulfobacteriota bacterium]|nr:hypothetical protein [Thermodesulfobacteriota bacterium]
MSDKLNQRVSIHKWLFSAISVRLTQYTAHKDQTGFAKDFANAKDISEVYDLW